MSATRILLDTNIAIYLFRGHEKLVRELDYNDLSISSITRVELLAWKEIDDVQKLWMENFMERCELIRVNKGIEDIGIGIIREYGLGIADALVAATAMFEGIALMTADKDFKRIDRGLKLLFYS